MADNKKSPQTSDNPPTNESEIPSSKSKNLKKTENSPANPPTQEQTPENPNTPAQPPPQRGGGLSIFKLVFYYYIINQVIGFFFPKSGGQHNPNLYYNMFNNDEPFELVFQISKFNYFSKDERKAIETWKETGLQYNYNSENYREKVISFERSKLFNMSHLYVNVLIYSTEAKSSNFTSMPLQATYDLFELRPKKVLEEASLLFDEGLPTKKKEDPKNKSELFPHLRNRTNVLLVHDTNAYAKNQIPPQLPIEIIEDFKAYKPIVDISQFWLLRKDFILVEKNDTLIGEAADEFLNITISFNIYWSMKYLMQNQMHTSMGLYSDFGIMDGDSGLEEMKEMLTETNVYLLGVTMVVSFLHSIFEILVLKNELQFWQNVESHRGLSLRSLYLLFFVEIVQFLYLVDNETSRMVLVFSFLGICMSVYKIMKTTKFKRRADNKFPWYEVDHQDSYKQETEKYDKVATGFLMKIMTPFLIAYFIYSLMYEKHKGWYSFILSSLMSFIYMFGFIEMTPQIYINYKLKSVSHLPWRSLIYRFLNTIIDDLFAFIVTMPWLKRLSCFRDDVIFVIYLYQRWIYRVDPNRNDYGHTVEKKEQEKTAQPIENKNDTKAKNE